MAALLSRQPVNEYVIRIEDRSTGERMDFSIPARSVYEAEQKAFDAGWLVIDPTQAPPPQASETQIAAKANERAVTVGILKAAGFIALAVFALVILGNVVVFLVNQ